MVEESGDQKDWNQRPVHDHFTCSCHPKTRFLLSFFPSLLSLNSKLTVTNTQCSVHHLLSFSFCQVFYYSSSKALHLCCLLHFYYRGREFTWRAFYIFVFLFFFLGIYCSTNLVAISLPGSLLTGAIPFLIGVSKSTQPLSMVFTKLGSEEKDAFFALLDECVTVIYGRK